MGLIVSVYRNGSDCTNGGVSATHDRLTVVNVEGPFEPSDSAPAVLLTEGPGRGNNMILVPVERNASGSAWVGIRRDIGPMAGGNYASTCDSRWREAVGHTGAISIHDRFETVAEYRLLST